MRYLKTFARVCLWSTAFTLAVVVLATFARLAGMPEYGIEMAAVGVGMTIGVAIAVMPTRSIGR